MSIKDIRAASVGSTIAKVREIVSNQGASRDALHRVKDVLCELATRKDLFTFEHFPLPARDSGTANCLYRVSEDADHQYALYINVSHPGKSSAPHNHTTWAVVVGVLGDELNRLYERVDDGGALGRGVVRQAREVNVSPGTGICFLPKDIHSIHVEGSQPILHFHMYGKGLEQLTGRIGFDQATGTYKVYPPHRDIRIAP